jgi:quercetin dioxygenase-like cupin family protein/alkylhydroperoxidase/carboxymuconolactone decarboxylase family protein YurZ
MKLLITLLVSLFFHSISFSGANGKSQVFYPKEKQQTFHGPENLFTGNVEVRLLFPDNETSQFSGAYVTFSPGARTNWHLHPSGQHMIVTSGVALTGTREGKVIQFHAGETVWCPPDLDHWHGATPHSSMTHLVITGKKGDTNVVWKEKVTDQQYYSGLFNKEKNMQDTNKLSKSQRAIIPVAAYASVGKMPELKDALNRALDSGLTVNEAKEIFAHLYAYCGFPRSLNALGTLMQVVETRSSLGIKDEMGKESTPITEDYDKSEYGEKVRNMLSGVDTTPPQAPWQKFAPIVDTFLKEHLFADLFARDVLGHQQREIVTISALAMMSGTENQLAYHLRAAMNTGLNQSQMMDFLKEFKKIAEKSQADLAEQMLQNILR